MSEKDYVNRTLTILEKILTALFAVFCAVVSYLVAEYRSEDPSSLIIYGSLAVLFVVLICFVWALVLYKKYLRRLRKL